MAKKASSTLNVKDLSNADLGKILDEQAPLIGKLTADLEDAERRLKEAKAEIARRAGATLLPAPATRKGPKPKAAKTAGKKATSERKRGERGSGFPHPTSMKGVVLAAVKPTDMTKDEILAVVKPKNKDAFAVSLSNLKTDGFLVSSERGVYRQGPKYAEYAAWLKSQN
jgi:hypothetical protein